MNALAHTGQGSPTLDDPVVFAQQVRHALRAASQHAAPQIGCAVSPSFPRFLARFAGCCDSGLTDDSDRPDFLGEVKRLLDGSDDERDDVLVYLFGPLDKSTDGDRDRLRRKHHGTLS